MDPIRAPRGTQLSCKGWPQEAALRMLMNNLDPDVAERPEDLAVYGGTGKAARSRDDYHATARVQRRLETKYLDEVAPDLDSALRRVDEWRGKRQPRSIAVVGNAADVYAELVRRGVTPDLVTDQTSAHDPLNGYVPQGLTLDA